MRALKILLGFFLIGWSGLLFLARFGTHSRLQFLVERVEEDWGSAAFSVLAFIPTFVCCVVCLIVGLLIVIRTLDPARRRYPRQEEAVRSHNGDPKA